MKLARPDLRHPRIVLAGPRALPAGEGDDAGLAAALRARGLHARWLAWNDPDTEGADVVVLGAPLDLADHLEAFLAWTRRVRNLLNAPDAVAWNADQRYLADLDAAGVPTVPGAFLAPGEPDATAHASHHDSRAVDGETALVFLAGEQSHAFTTAAPQPARNPVSDGPGACSEERLCPAEPDFEVWDVGLRALAAAAAHLGCAARDFLYARVDVIGGRDDPRLRKLDLVGPSLGWRQLSDRDGADARRRFALGVESALERLGLGPL